MKRIIVFLCFVGLSFGFLSCNSDKPVKVLFITGGHDYDQENFHAMLGKLPITYDHVEHPGAHAMFKEDKIGAYDVVLLYDMPKEISPEAQQDFIDMLHRGKGLVVLHHAFCSYDYWPEFVKIVGGRYHHFQWTKDGEVQKPSTYHHDATMQIRVEDQTHPIVKGITDFEIIDEAYGGTEIRPNILPVLSTSSPLNGPFVCWTNQYGKSRVVALTLGHDKQAWENASFIQVLSQAIVWAKKVERQKGFDGQNAEYEITKPLPRSTPQAEKVNRRGVSEFLQAIRSAELDLHSLMIVRNGKVVTEQWFGDNAPDKLHAMYSVSKTFTATAIGFAVSENRLKVTDKVASFFPDKMPAEASPGLQSLEIRHLLTMSVGHDIDRVSRARREANADWVKAFLSVPLDVKPGTVFLYNNLASYMLSAIIQKVTGEKLIDYLTPRLFSPLGINGVTWDESPQGINLGGWGLSVKTEDMAKLGQLFLQKGKWNDKQLLPESWIAEATTSQIASLPSGPLTIKPEKSDWTQGYGYQMWRCRHNGIRADGANGQFIIILPEKDAVIVLTSNVSDMQAELNLVWEHLLPALN
ncbi:MAG: serine hydrolase [Tannerella sp.]|jgi:CubicO group peptidase (beta-lactamase class C family)/type 1 glutamine amidotransferase|nr:serine hydrolase [Tannerella sp.]